MSEGAVLARTEEVELLDPDPDLFRRLLPVARSIFTATFADRYEEQPFERFCDQTYRPGGTMDRDYRSDGVRWRVAVSAGRPVGYAKLTPLRAPAVNPRPCALELQQLYVQPMWHGSGLADRLMRWAIEAAREAGGTELYLTVFDHNERAKRFYARYGFSEVGRCKFQLGDRVDEDRIWRTDLAESSGREAR